jgi:ribosomal-protein-alanine N-acetyltransferase
VIFGFGARPSAPVIRPLRADKAEDCARLHAASFAHPWSAEEIARLIGDTTTLPTAALDAGTGTLRGFALARRAADEAEILTVAVEPAWRGRGVGRALMADAIRRAANEGAQTMFLEVDETNIAALALYHHLGFVKVGERPGYYRRSDGSRALALVMRRVL